MVVQTLGSSMRLGCRIGKVVGIVAGSHLSLCTQPRRWLLPQEDWQLYPGGQCLGTCFRNLIHSLKDDGDIHVKAMQSWGKSRGWRFKQFPGVEGTKLGIRLKFKMITPAWRLGERASSTLRYSCWGESRQRSLMGFQSSQGHKTQIWLNEYTFWG